MSNKILILYFVFITYQVELGAHIIQVDESYLLSHVEFYLKFFETVL